MRHVVDVPRHIHQQAAQWLATGGQVAPARAAATVLLVRDPSAETPPGEASTAVSPEVFVMHRSKTMAFAGGMVAFPGGSVDPRDSDRDVPWHGPPPSAWASWFTCSESDARALVCAAVRETFEETGVLLAATSDGAVVDATHDDQWEDLRQSMVRHEVALSEALTQRSLVLRADLLRPWSHWITPEFEPKRYDTRFFLAALPHGQQARHIEHGEAVQSLWVNPAHLLHQRAEGHVVMLPPTAQSVAEVAAQPSVAALLTEQRTIAPILPTVEQRGDGSLEIVVDLPAGHAPAHGEDLDRWPSAAAQTSQQVGH